MLFKLKFVFLLSKQASYERMNGAKEALAEFFKEVSKGLIESAPNRSFEFTRNEDLVSFSDKRFWVQLSFGSRK